MLLFAGTPDYFKIKYYMKNYKKYFHKDRHKKTIYSANTILSILLNRLSGIESVIDVGCGTGTWLSVLQKKGIKDIQGVDGNWVDLSLLSIDKDYFKQVDLTQELKIHTKYDLAISLEVAEHLDFIHAKNFVSTLAKLSDYILFSAAVPLQGGNHHVNEQWQDYWVNLFNDEGYAVYDFIRPVIWNDDKIPFWYKQNILFFARIDNLQNENKFDRYLESGSSMPLNAVHPDLHILLGVKRSAYFLWLSIVNHVKKWF
jgi:SAM-dependent methyltransferase